MTTDDRLPVDVIVPAWGRYRAHLGGALRSAEAAHRRIVVTDSLIDADSGSSELRCSDLVLIDPCRTIASARQAGLARVEQPYVLFLDADDRLRPDALSWMVTQLEIRPDVVAVTGLMARSSGQGCWPPLLPARLACLPGGLAVLLARNVLPAVGACMIRIDAVRGVPLFPDLQDEDWHAAVRLRASGMVSFHNVVLLDYTVASGSLSRRRRPETDVQESRAALLSVAESAVGRRVLSWRLLHRAVAPYRSRRDMHLFRLWGSTP